MRSALLWLFVAWLLSVLYYFKALNDLWKFLDHEDLKKIGKGLPR